ncbi:transposase [Nonomuraea pusilla]|uniref:transposase n=1 Tax=Nonomuraea pusilla TaxID=46177 RepID=UPI000B80D841
MRSSNDCRDEVWELLEPVAPLASIRPQGGGRRRVDDRTILAAIGYVATTGCAWRQLLPVFGASWQTVNRRFAEWSQACVWAKKLGPASSLPWNRCDLAGPPSCEDSPRWI